MNTSISSNPTHSVTPPSFDYLTHIPFFQTRHPSLQLISSSPPTRSAISRATWPQIPYPTPPYCSYLPPSLSYLLCSSFRSGSIICRALVSLFITPQSLSPPSSLSPLGLHVPIKPSSPGSSWQIVSQLLSHLFKQVISHLLFLSRWRIWTQNVVNFPPKLLPDLLSSASSLFILTNTSPNVIQISTFGHASSQKPCAEESSKFSVMNQVDLLIFVLSHF